MKKQPALSVVLECRLLLDNIGMPVFISIMKAHCVVMPVNKPKGGQVAEQKAACTLVFGVQAAFRGWKNIVN